LVIFRIKEMNQKVYYYYYYKAKSKEITFYFRILKKFFLQQNMKKTQKILPPDGGQILSIREQIIDIMKQEYLQEINSTSKTKEQTTNQDELYTLGFSDITVWFYKRNSQQSLEEARYIWDLLPQTPLQRHNLIEYLNLYTDQIFDKHEKYVYYQKKYRKVENIINRTQDLIESLRTSFNKINEPRSASKENGIEIGSNSTVIPETLKFSIHLSTLENSQTDYSLKHDELLGYHVELGYQTNIVSSGIQEVSSKQVVDFQNRKVDFTFSLKEGSIFIYLYEDYMENGEIKKSLVAKRNLDLFTSINEKFLNNIIGFQGDDIELSADFDEMKFEPFYLKKMEAFNNENPTKDAKEKGDLEKEDYVRLNMAIVVEKFRRYEDLQIYYKILVKRKEHLETEMRNIKLKANGYKKKLALLLLPFSEIITFDEKCITINKKLDKKQNRKRKDCSIF